jgi:hypothetical protein
MPNWVAVRGASRVTSVAFDGREPRICVRFKADMRAKMRRHLSKYDYPPDLKERAVELALHQAELFAGTGVT